VILGILEPIRGVQLSAAEILGIHEQLCSAETLSIHKPIAGSQRCVGEIQDPGHP
jgi:hypothetical protein